MAGSWYTETLQGLGIEVRFCGRVRVRWQDYGTQRH